MSNKLQVNKIALAHSLATISLVGYIICILVTVIFPESLMILFNSWFHGMDLSVLSPADGNWVFGTGSLVLGLVTFPIFGWITGYLIASLYNKFSK